MNKVHICLHSLAEIEKCAGRKSNRWPHPYTFTVFVKILHHIINFYMCSKSLRFHTMPFVVEFGVINSFRTWSVLVCRMRGPCLHISTRSILVTSAANRSRFFCAKCRPIMNMVKPGHIQDKVFVKRGPVSKSSSSKIGPHEDPLFFPSQHIFKLTGYISLHRSKKFW
jgi:hypothetical protein